MGAILMLRSSSDELMHKARKAKNAVCDLVEELEDTAKEMKEEYGERSYRKDDYPYRDDREYRGGRYDYRRY